MSRAPPAGSTRYRNDSLFVSFGNYCSKTPVQQRPQILMQRAKCTQNETPDQPVPGVGVGGWGAKHRLGGLQERLGSLRAPAGPASAALPGSDLAPPGTACALRHRGGFHYLTSLRPRGWRVPCPHPARPPPGARIRGCTAGAHRPPGN